MKNYASHLVLLILTVAACSPSVKVTTGFDVVIYGGQVMDPESGTDAVLNIGIIDGTIRALTKDSLSGNRNINARGLVVSPGFVDLHCHGMTNDAFALMVQDGVTTGLELEVGTGNVNQWYEDQSEAQYVNYGVSIGHIKVRMEVMGDEGGFLPSGLAKTTVANEEQISKINDLIEIGLDQGAVGVGFGLAYTPAATTAEFESVLQIAANRGASSHIHLRAGKEGLEEAIKSASKIGASLHIVHINSSGAEHSAEFIKLIEQAVADGNDISTEAYPYEAGMTMIESSLFDEWETWDDDQIGIHQWSETGEFLNRESFGKYRQQGGGVIIHSRTDDMTEAALNSPLTMIASDGFLEDGKGHPRTSGTFSKVLGKYVREKKLYSLMDALRRMTIAPAQRLEKYVPAMSKKGRIRVDADADITVFDPTSIIDKATYTDPAIPSDGIAFVLVDGKVVVDDGELLTEAKYGKAVRKE